MAPQDKKTVEEMLNEYAREVTNERSDTFSDFVDDGNDDKIGFVATRMVIDFVAQQVTAERERIIGLVEEDYRKWAIQGSWLAREVSNTLQSLKHKLLNSK